MKKITFMILALSIISWTSLAKDTHQVISPEAVNELVNEFNVDQNSKERLKSSLMQISVLWTSSDGDVQAFKEFCKKHYAKTDEERLALFEKLSDAFDTMLGGFKKMYMKLKEPIDQTGSELSPIDYILGSYATSSHFSEDMFSNKIAFITILNFPNYSLEDKAKFADKRTRLDWAYVRMGDMFTTRVPANINQQENESRSNGSVYISNYNIVVGNLLSENGNAPFPKGMKLISHWNLRDEIKSNYSLEGGQFEKQNLIYEVMKRIVLQQIPENVIDSEELQWAPISNKLYKDGKEISFKSEPNTRYQHFLNNFKSQLEIDKYNTQNKTFIQRSYNGAMEMSKKDIENIFIEFLTSPKVKQVANLIETKLDRKLCPFDIWYDGFKGRTEISEDELSEKTRNKYPNAKALENDLPNLLVKLGFQEQEAKRITSKIQVDASRGAGHAWRAPMIGEKARLRSRIGEKGLDYKGFNIGIHEFGHNVEQTISLYDVDYYTLRGVPNTAFTEALAFIFQKRDLSLLGISNPNPDKRRLEALDVFWNCYEIMGVSLVDMYIWDWLYENPNASAEDLKNNLVRISREVWNKYYYPVFGEKDSPILGIYSHMITNPLYLANYPMGHLIEFQLEEHLRGKNFADEVLRIFKIGNIYPQQWMKEAVGSEVSSKALLNAITF